MKITGKIVAYILLMCSIFLIHTKKKEKVGRMKLTSNAFEHNQFIPAKYTCKGENCNPPLHIESVPRQAKSLALIVDDPDAPHSTWDHWIVWNIPPTTAEIKENSIPGQEGLNSFNKLHYGGPCPPSGTHRYFFKLYALTDLLPLKPGATKSQLMEAMEGKIIASAELIGLFSKT